MGSGLIDRRTVRLAQELVIAGSSMLMLGLAAWLLAVAGRLIPRTADSAMRVVALGLVVAGAVCGLFMAIAVIRAGRVPHSEDPEPAASSPPVEANPVNEGRVWWRAPNSPATAWGPDPSDEWLRSLRTPQAHALEAHAPLNQPPEAQLPEAQPAPGSQGAAAE